MKKETNITYELGYEFPHRKYHKRSDAASMRALYTLFAFRVHNADYLKYLHYIHH